MSVIDCRGLACPEPVLRCRQEIEEKSPMEIEVLVDNNGSKENVYRFLKSQGYSIDKVHEQGGIFKIHAKRDKNIPSNNEEVDVSLYSCEISTKKEHDDDKQLVFITSSTIGHGNDELGRALMLNFLRTLPEMGKSLWRIILLNGGVKLATEQGEILEALKKLEQLGVSILVCGTCLDFFELLEQKKIGETTNMLDVVTSLQLATKIIKI